MTATTCEEISNSSDAVWEALCLAEDGDTRAAQRLVRTLSDTDKRIFTEGLEDLYAKRAREAAHRSEPARAPVRCDVPKGRDCEGAILAQQERDTHPELLGL
jgi:hypothetical protein